MMPQKIDSYKSDCTCLKQTIQEDETIRDDGCLLPGLIDAHIHVCLCRHPAVRYGTVAVVSDIHEIANVPGVAGVDYMIEDGGGVDPINSVLAHAPVCLRQPGSPLRNRGRAVTCRRRCGCT